jgi:hypothetical protein
MRVGDLAIADLRPLFIQALEEGRKRGSVKGFVFEKMKKDGVEMTLTLAERFYSKFYEAYLLQAMHSVIGVLSLGLYFLTKGDLEKAVEIIAKDPLVMIFRVGWTKVVELRKLRMFSQYLTGERQEGLIEKDLTEILSSPPQANWSGVQEYQRMLQEYTREANIRRYHEWLRKKFFRREALSLEERKIPLNNALGEIFNGAYYLSLAIAEKPFAPLAYSHILQIAKVLGTKEGQQIFRKRVEGFLAQVPKVLQAVAAKEMKSFMKNEAAKVTTLLDENKLGELATFLATSFLNESDPDTYMEEIYQAHREELKDLSIKSLLHILKDEQPLDESKRLAIVDEILKRKAGLSVMTVAAILVYAEQKDWAGKIRWIRFNGEEIFQILRDERLGFIQKEILEDMFSSCLDEASAAWWQTWPLELVQLAFQTVERSRSLILQYVRIPVELLVEKAVNEDISPFYAFMIEPKDWADVWMNGLGKVLLPALLSYAQPYQWWSREEAITNLLAVCITLIERYRAEAEADLLVEAPFYVFELEDVLEEMLSPDEFELFKEKIAALIK